MIMFIRRTECYWIWPRFSRKLTHVLICKLPLWVYQIPSAYTANIYPIERQGFVFMPFHFLRHQDLGGGKRNWDDCFHTGVLLHGLCFSAELNLLQLQWSLHVCRNSCILENCLYDKWNNTSRRHLSYVYISKWCGSVRRDLYTVIAGAESLMSTLLKFLWVYFRLDLVWSYGLNDNSRSALGTLDCIFQFNFIPKESSWCTMWTEQHLSGFNLKIHFWSALLIWTRKS